MRTHAAIVEAAGRDAEVAEKLGAKPHQPRDWRIRNSIPPERWNAFAEQGWATLEELADAAEAKAAGSENRTAA